MSNKLTGEPGVETELTVVEMLEACYRVLEAGSVLAVDVDGYLLSRVLEYAREEFGEHSYAIAQTTALTKDGEPDRSTPGMYGSSGGYASVLVWFWSRRTRARARRSLLTSRASASARTGVGEP